MKNVSLFYIVFFAFFQKSASLAAKGRFAGNFFQKSASNENDISSRVLPTPAFA